MSVCYQGWKTTTKNCPALLIQDEFGDVDCDYSVFPSGIMWYQHKFDEKLPDTCIYVPILKLFAEVVEMADLQIMPHPPEHKHPLSREWIKVEFWVRRA